MEQQLAGKLLLDYYRSHLTRRILDKIAQMQQCDCLRFEFPDVCVSTKLKVQFEKDNSHLKSKVNDENDNILYFERLVIESKTILMFFAKDKEHYDKPDRCFSFTGSLDQLKRELKPYYRLFQTCSILTFSNDYQKCVTISPLPINESEKVTNVMESNMDVIRKARDQIHDKEMEQLDDILSQFTN